MSAPALLVLISEMALFFCDGDKRECKALSPESAAMKRRKGGFH